MKSLFEDSESDALRIVRRVVEEKVRKILGSSKGEDTHVPAKRMVDERNDTLARRAPTPTPPGCGTEDILNIGKILNRSYDETPTQAAERVVKERDAALAEVNHLRQIGVHDADQIRALRTKVECLNGEKIGTYLMKLRTILGATKDEDTHMAAERVVADTLRPYFSRDIVPLRRLLKATVGETIQEAVERVVAERDYTLMHLSAARDLSDKDQERAEAALKLRDEAVRERDALCTLPQDMAKALGIASYLSPEDTIETCKHHREQYTKICESRRALLNLRGRLKRALYLSPAATHDEVLAECVALVRSREAAQKERVDESTKGLEREVIEYLKKGVEGMQKEIREARLASDRKNAMLIRKLSAAGGSKKQNPGLP